MVEKKTRKINREAFVNNVEIKGTDLFSCSRVLPLSKLFRCLERQLLTAIYC